MRKLRRLLLLGSDSRYGREVISGIHAYCRRSGLWEYHLEADRPSVLERARFSIEHWKADGIITSAQTPEMERLIRDSGLPAVNFSGNFRSLLPTVVADSYAVGRMAARHLIDSGSKHFAFSSRTSEWSAQNRCRGFVEEVRRAGYSCEIFNDEYVGWQEPGWVQNRQRMDRWLLSLKKPVAIMCIYDNRGQEVTWACARLGLRIPDDVALVAVGNDHLLCQMCTPPLSSVDTNPQRIGFEAMRLLERIMRGRKPSKSPILIKPRRVAARQSSDIIAVNDPEIAQAIRFIRDHPGEPIGVKDLLQQIPISRRSLELRFVTALGRTPKAEITRVRMERAKSLLSDGDLPISTVAVESGFSSQEKFSTAFRRECGVTPTEFRRTCRADARPLRA